MAVISYPLNLSSSEVYLTFTRYANEGFTTDSLREIDNKFSNFKQIPTDILGLPVPNNMSDSSVVNFSENTDSSLLESVVKNGLNKLGVEQKVTNVAQTLGSKGTLNQQLLIYTGVGVKNWTWNWNLIPESKQEAINIVSIIKNFELAQLPFSSSKRELITFPDLFRIKFNGTKPNLIRFLPCYLTNITYDPGDHFQIYSDGNFSEINLSLSFSEIVSRSREIQQNVY